MELVSVSFWKKVGEIQENKNGWPFEVKYLGYRSNENIFFNLSLSAISCSP